MALKVSWEDTFATTTYLTGWWLGGSPGGYRPLAFLSISSSPWVMFHAWIWVWHGKYSNIMKLIEVVSWFPGSLVGIKCCHSVCVSCYNKSRHVRKIKKLWMASIGGFLSFNHATTPFFPSMSAAPISGKSCERSYLQFFIISHNDIRHNDIAWASLSLKNWINVTSFSFPAISATSSVISPKPVHWRSCSTTKISPFPPKGWKCFSGFLMQFRQSILGLKD